MLTLALMAVWLLPVHLRKYSSLYGNIDKGKHIFFLFIEDLCITNVYMQEMLLMSTTVIKFSLWEPPSDLISTSCKSFPCKISPKVLPGLIKRGNNAELV